MEEGLTAMLGPDKDTGAEVTIEQVLAESGMDPEDLDDEKK